MLCSIYCYWTKLWEELIITEAVRAEIAAAKCFGCISCSLHVASGCASLCECAQTGRWGRMVHLPTVNRTTELVHGLCAPLQSWEDLWIESCVRKQSWCFGMWQKSRFQVQPLFTLDSLWKQLHEIFPQLQNLSENSRGLEVPMFKVVLVSMQSGSSLS